MGWFGDLFDYEKFNAKGMWKQIKDDPERLFLGAADPIGSKLWGEILHKDYEPIVDQWGGSTNKRLDEADAEGIDTGAARDMDSAAHTIAQFYAGNYASSAAGLGGSAGAADGAGAAGSTAGPTGNGVYQEGATAVDTNAVGSAGASGGDWQDWVKRGLKAGGNMGGGGGASGGSGESPLAAQLRQRMEAEDKLNDQKLSTPQFTDQNLYAPGAQPKAGAFGQTTQDPMSQDQQMALLLQQRMANGQGYQV